VNISKSQTPLRYLDRTSSEPAPNQLQTGSEPDSVMEFGFNETDNGDGYRQVYFLPHWYTLAVVLELFTQIAYLHGCLWRVRIN